MKLRKVYSKVKNSRKDYIHKMTSNLIAKGSGVVVEGLFIPDMVKKRRFAKGVHDAAWGEMRRQLEYKCKWNHKPFIILDQFEPTTKTCSCCGNLQKTPSTFGYTNAKCYGFELCQDHNAAINILKKGIEILEYCKECKNLSL